MFTSTSSSRTSSSRAGLDERIGYTLDLDVNPDEALTVALAERLRADPSLPISAEVRELACETETSRLRLLKPGMTPATFRSVADDSEDPWLVVTHDGSVWFLNYTPDTALSDRDLTRAIEDGLTEAEPHRYVVILSEGTGGGEDWIDLANWLWNHGISLGADGIAAWAGTKALRWIGGKLRYGQEDRRAHMVAALWKDMQGISAPYQPRYVVDRKSAWAVSDLVEKLRVNPDVCKALLRSLGYLPDAGGTWHLGTTKKAKARREKWIADEATDAVSATFELYPWRGPKE